MRFDDLGVGGFAPRRYDAKHVFLEPTMNRRPHLNAIATATSRRGLAALPCLPQVMALFALVGKVGAATP
jgi:hypothetical protein